jgi:hypothetical protein
MDARVSTEHANEAIDGETAKLIKSFQDRARSLRFTAHAILAVIFFLLVGGAAIFLLASQITLADFNREPDFIRALAELDRQQQQAQSQLSTLREPVFKNGEAVRSFLADHSRQGPPEGQVTALFDGASVGPLVDALALQKGRHIQIFIDTGPARAIQAIILPDDDLINGLRQLSLLPIQANEIENTLADGNLIAAAAETVKRDKRSAEIAQLTRTAFATPDPRQEVSPVAQIIQTNVTRFGTIIMIIFLVSILTPLYRYNLRLASYYEARADALILMETKLRSAGFIKLVGALTPTLDFGKAPPTPIEQLVQLVQGAGPKVKSAGKAGT